MFPEGFRVICKGIFSTISLDVLHVLLYPRRFIPDYPPSPPSMLFMFWCSAKAY